jgi:hypothetical protein
VKKEVKYMKKTLAITMAILFALTITSVTFASEEKVAPPAEGSQPTKETGPNFEQMKANHLKKLDKWMNSLQQEKACVQAAKNQDDLSTCRLKHKAKMKKHRDGMRKSVGPDGPGDQTPPQGK